MKLIVILITENCSSEMGDDKICVICKDGFTGRIIQYVSCVEFKGPVHLSCIPGNKRGKGRMKLIIYLSF